MTTIGEASITPRTGDVILVEQDGDPISKLIARFTNSPFSHSIVVLDPVTFADANPVTDPDPPTPGLPKAGADIVCFGVEKLEASLQEVKRFVLYRPNSEQADPRLLSEAVDKFQRDSLAPAFRIRFSDGAVCGLWMLRTLESIGPIQALPALRAATDALFWAVEDGKSRLFCSEFCFRVLDAAGQRPATPEIPVVPTPGFPTDDPVYSLVPWFDRLIAFFESEWRKLMAELGLNEQTWLTLQEVIGRWRRAHKLGLRPERLERANYFTPGDFEHCPSMHAVAHRTKTDPGWVWMSAAPS